MDWNLAIQKEREVLKRIVALLWALADLADRACGRSRPVRCLVLWILRPGMTIALECIADAGPVDQALVLESGDSIAEARRFSRCFRAASRVLKKLLKALDRCQAEIDGPMPLDHRPERGFRFARPFAGRDLRACIIVRTGLLRHPSARGPPLPERCDSS